MRYDFDKQENNRIHVIQLIFVNNQQEYIYINKLTGVSIFGQLFQYANTNLIHCSNRSHRRSLKRNNDAVLR